MTAQTQPRAFPFIELNERDTKPRTRGVTEIRGPYYTPMGKRYLQTSWRQWAGTSTPSSSPAAPSA